MLKRLFNAVGRRTPNVPAPSTNRPPTAASLAPRDVSDADFAEVVLASQQLVVVDVWAEWCEPCQIMSAYMNFLAQDFTAGLLITALDADANPLTTERYGILGLPTLLFIRNGAEVDRQVGVIDYAALRTRVEGLLR